MTSLGLVRLRLGVAYHRTALTGRTVLLPTDDVEEYTQHVARFEAEFRPVAGREKELTKTSPTRNGV
jgi:hypothetical protein